MKIVCLVFARHKNYTIFSELSQCDFALFSELNIITEVIIIHREIKEVCKIRKIPIYKLEEDLGFSKGYISKLTTSNPSVNNAIKIANYLEVPLEQLIVAELKEGSNLCQSLKLQKKNKKTIQQGLT